MLTRPPSWAPSHLPVAQPPPVLGEGTGDCHSSPLAQRKEKSLSSCPCQLKISHQDTNPLGPREQALDAPKAPIPPWRPNTPMAPIFPMCPNTPMAPIPHGAPTPTGPHPSMVPQHPCDTPMPPGPYRKPAPVAPCPQPHPPRPSSWQQVDPQSLVFHRSLETTRKQELWQVFEDICENPGLPKEQIVALDPVSESHLSLMPSGPLAQWPIGLRWPRRAGPGAHQRPLCSLRSLPEVQRPATGAAAAHRASRGPGLHRGPWGAEGACSASAAPAPWPLSCPTEPLPPSGAGRGLP